MPVTLFILGLPLAVFLYAEYSYLVLSGSNGVVLVFIVLIKMGFFDEKFY